MKKLNITKNQFNESRYFTTKYGKLEYVSESGNVYKTSKGHVLKFVNESSLTREEVYDILRGCSRKFAKMGDIISQCENEFTDEETGHSVLWEDWFYDYADEGEYVCIPFDKYIIVIFDDGGWMLQPRKEDRVGREHCIGDYGLTNWYNGLDKKEFCSWGDDLRYYMLVADNIDKIEESFNDFVEKKLAEID